MKSSSNPAVVMFPVADVIVDRETRQRTTLDKDVDNLADAIERDGLIHPITIHEDGKLVAGERRLEAHRRRGWTEIRAQIFERLSIVDAYRIELQENLQRKALSWQDEVRAVLVYHNMRKQSFGGWTIQGTATDIQMSVGQTHQYLKIAEHLEDQEVMSCPTLTGAWNLIKGRAERAAAAAKARGLEVASVMPVPIARNATREEKTAAISDLLKGGIDAQPSPPTADKVSADLAIIDAGALATASLKVAAAKEAQAAESPVITADFISWAETYDGPPFDVLHVDFPYGKGYAGSNTRRTGRAHIAPIYADDPDVLWDLIDALITYQDKLAYEVAHMLFWFDMDYYGAIKGVLTRKGGWTLVQPHPLIWHKPYQGVASDPKRRPRHTYETAFLLSRGDRQLVKLDQDVFVGRVDEKLHINQKSHDMLRQFLGMLVDEHTAVFDPTCGSGSALAAARSLGANRVLGLELEEGNAEVARFLLARDGAHNPGIAGESDAGGNGDDLQNSTGDDHSEGTNG